MASAFRLGVAVAAFGWSAGCVGSGDDTVASIASDSGLSADVTEDHSTVEGGASAEGGRGDGGSPGAMPGDAKAADVAAPPPSGAPVASLSASTIAFGAQSCGATGVTKALTIANPGTATLAVTSTVVGSAFLVTPTSLSIPSGTSGVLSVSASIPTPAPAGTPINGTLSIFTNDPAHTMVAVPLSATPTGGTISGTSQYAFSSTEVGVSAPSLAVQLKNTGNGPLTLSVGTPSNPSITLSGVSDGGAGVVLAPGDTWSASASFLPTAPSAALTASSAVVTSGAVCGTNVTSLTFTGSTASGTLVGWPGNNTLDFGPANCGGVPPPPQSVRLTNTGATAARVTGVDAAKIGGFTTDTMTGSVLAANGGTLTMNFTAPSVPEPTPAAPTVSLSPVTATVVIHTDADSTPLGTSLTLKEEPAGAVLAFGTPSTSGCTTSPNFGDFSSPLLLLQSTPPESFCVVNTGSEAAQVTLSAAENGVSDGTSADGGSELADGSTGASAPSAFLLLAPTFTIGGSASASSPSVEQDELTFQPLHANATVGSLAMSVDGATSLCQLLPTPLPLSGNAIGGGPVVTPELLTFDATCGGSAPAMQTFIVSNSGTVDLTWTMSGVAGSGAGQYSVSAVPPPGLLAPNASSTVTVTAAAIPSPAPNPNPAGLVAQVTITTDVPYDSPHVVTLSEIPIGDQLSASVGSLRFGQVPVGTSVGQSFTLLNNANAGSPPANVTLAFAGTGSSVYLLATQPSVSLAAGSSATQSLTFDAPSAGSSPASLSISASTQDSLCAPLPVPIALSGTGTAGSVSLSATSLAFGQPNDSSGFVNCGATGTPQTLSITNVGNQSYHVSGLSLGKGSSSPFSLSGPAMTAGVELAIGGSSSVTITPAAIPAVADPNDASAFADTLTVTTDATGDSPHAVQLVMQARGAVIASTPLSTSWNFGTVGTGSIGTYTTSIQNTGNAPATVTLQGLSMPAIFGLRSNPTPVPPAGVTALVGQFTPPAPDGSWSDEGQLEVTTPDAFCAPLPMDWDEPIVALSGSSSSSAAVTIAGSLVFPVTDCGGVPAGQSVTLTNQTNQSLTYTVGFASGMRYTAFDPSSGKLPADGATTVVVNPKAVTPGQGVLAGSAPYADQLIVAVSTSPVPTTFTVPISWTLNGAVLSLPSGAGSNSDSQGAFYVADTTSGFSLPMVNSGTAPVDVNFVLQPSGGFSIAPAPPSELLPGVTTLDELVAGGSAPACPSTTSSEVTFAYSGPVCQPFSLPSVAVRACSGTYVSTGGSNPLTDGGIGTPPSDGGGGDDAEALEDAGSSDGEVIDSAASGDGADGASEDATVPSDGGGASEGDAAKEGGDAGEGGSALVACTSSGQTGCVSCEGNADGACTPTEAELVALDIRQGLATTGGADPDNGCYSCLFNEGCIDDTVFGDTGNECGDLSGNFTNGAGTSVDAVSTCLATLECLLSSSCGTTNGGLTNCYCGSGGGTPSVCASPSAGPSLNGVCLSEEAAGFKNMQSDTADIIGKDFTDIKEPSGMANQVIACGQVGGRCPQCLQ